MQFANFSNAELFHANFDSADLTLADFRGAKIKDSTFAGCDLTLASFDNTNTERMFLSGANLKKTSFMCSILSETIFHKSSAIEANLIHANVDCADFTESNFSGSRLHGLDLSTATLEITVLDGALITMTKFPATIGSMVDFEKAFGCEGTELPTSVARPSHWASVRLEGLDKANKAYWNWQNSRP